MEKSIRLGGVDFRYLAVDASYDHTDCSPDHHEAPAYQPYWTELWDSTVGICRFLSDESLTGKRVLDLGCGLGMAGTFAASRGALVTMADAVPEAILFARYNSYQFSNRVHCRQIDWHCDSLPGQFELIIGADILYDPADWMPLSTFWQQHLAPGGRVVLGEPGRETGKTFRQTFDTNQWQLTENRSPGFRNCPTRNVFQLVANESTANSDI